LPDRTPGDWPCLLPCLRPKKEHSSDPRSFTKIQINSQMNRPKDIGLEILESVGGKRQTGETNFSEDKGPDEPTVSLRPQPGELKKQLRGSIGKGRASGHDAQSEGRTGQRTSVKTQTAAGSAHIHRRGVLDEKPTSGCQTTYCKSQFRLRSRLATLHAKRFGRRPLSCCLARQVNCPRTNHSGLPDCCPYMYRYLIVN